MLISLLLSAHVALADIPPSPDYVERCTVENYASAELECASCSAYFGGREPCEALEQKGYSQRCRTSGASVWEEVMCRPGTSKPSPPVAPKSGDEPAPEATPEPSPKRERRCSTTAGSASWLALLGLVFVGLRRSR